MATSIKDMELVVMDIMDTRYLHQYCDPGAGGDNYRDTVLLAKVMEQLFVIVHGQCCWCQ